MTALEAWAKAMVGTPFRWRGRDRTGLDCYGLVRLAYREVLGIALPDYPYEPADVDAIAALIRSQEPDWLCVAAQVGSEIRFGAERAGDILEFRVEGSPIHLGLVLAPGRALHASVELGVVRDRYRSVRWRHRVLGIYRYRGGADA